VSSSDFLDEGLGHGSIVPTTSNGSPQPLNSYNYTQAGRQCYRGLWLRLHLSRWCQLRARIRMIPALPQLDELRVLDI